MATNPNAKLLMGEYQQDPFQQGVLDNFWQQFNQNLPGVYSPINAAVGGAGRAGSGIHARMLGDAGNRAFLGATGQAGQMQSQDYQSWQDRRRDLLSTQMQKQATLGSARISGRYGLQAARASARPGLINAMMGAGGQMDYAMNPWAQGLGYLGQYGNMMSPYSQGYGGGQSGLSGAIQGGIGGGMMGAGF